MPRAKKNPVTEMPVVGVDPVEPSPQSNPNNVVPISTHAGVVQSEPPRDTATTDQWMSELGITLI